MTQAYSDSIGGIYWNDGLSPNVSMRILARFVDLFLAVVVGVAGGYIVSGGVDPNSASFTRVWPYVAIVGSLAYEFICMTLWGRTLGKWIFGLQVVKKPGGLRSRATGTTNAIFKIPVLRVRVIQALIRSFIWPGLVEFMIDYGKDHSTGIQLTALACALVTGLSMISSPSQSLHDKLVGTRVIYNRANPRLRNQSYPKAPDPTMPPPPGMTAYPAPGTTYPGYPAPEVATYPGYPAPSARITTPPNVEATRGSSINNNHYGKTLSIAAAIVGLLLVLWCGNGIYVVLHGFFTAR